MRLYTFTHFILRSIQQGIQSGHVSHAIVQKYIDDRKTSKELKALKEWLPQPTIICLNGGNSAELRAIWSAVDNNASFLKLPYQIFCEDQETLDGIVTGCGVIIPQRLYDAAALLRTKPDGYLDVVPKDLHTAEIDLINLINKYPLAN